LYKYVRKAIKCSWDKNDMEMAIHGAPLETLKSADEYKQYCTDV
jgi:hypothetical protein